MIRYSWPTRKTLTSLPEPLVPPPGLSVLHIFQGHTDGIYNVAWSPDGMLLASGSWDETARVWDVRSGRLLHTLQGNRGNVECIAWSPDGKLLACGCNNHVVLVWDVHSGSLLYTLQGHTAPVFSVAWSPDGKRLASGSSDKTARVWDARSGRLLHTLPNHTGWVECVAWSPDGTRLASCPNEYAVQVWDTNAGRLLYTLQGHTNSVFSVVWSPNGTQLASCSSDQTARVWDTRSGRLLHTLQNHTTSIDSIAWSPDGTQLATGSCDQTQIWDARSGRLLQVLQSRMEGSGNVAWSFDGSLLAFVSADIQARAATGQGILWRTDTWEPVAMITGLISSTVAWHPQAALLVTSGEYGEDLFLWKLDLATLLRQASSPETVYYKTAKVVLVGESGVGKSGLALVLTKQPFAPTESTHGRHIWLLDEQETLLSDRQRERRETWLWDLAGQRDYRIIHQLHLHEATVALIVFDAARDSDPLAGIRYWQRALRLAQQSHDSAILPLTIFLVAARIDRGGRAMSQERIAELVQELGCAGYIETSAKTGQGIDELSHSIHAALNWDSLPGVTSTKLLQNIKTFVLSKVQIGQLLLTVDELYQAFLLTSNTAPSGGAIRQQFEMVLRYLEAQGALRQLSFGNLVLLQSERLDAYASALLISVRNEPDGLGAISEERVRLGQFAIPQEDRISTAMQEQLLLIAMIEELISHEIVLRESGFLLFPSQSTREHPEQAELIERQRVTFSFAGPGLSIYTTLVVRLAQSDIFRMQGVWQRVVIYTTRSGGIFGLLLTPRGEEQTELGLFFDEAASEEMCFHFEDFIQRHLQKHASGSVQRRRRFACMVCGEVFTEKQVSNRRARGFTFIHCSTCDTRVSLLDGEERLDMSASSQVKEMERRADAQRDQQRATSILQGKRATQDFDVFLCHHGQDKGVVKQIGEQLKYFGVLPWLDEWELRPGLPWQRLLEQQIMHIKAAAVFVGKSGIGPWQQQELDAFLREFAQRDCPVIPVLLPDAPQQPTLPVFLRAMTWVDFRSQDPDPMKQLLWGITGKREIG